MGTIGAKFGPSGMVGLNIQARPGFLWNTTKSIGLILGSDVAITMHYVLAARLHAVPERYLLGSMLGSQYIMWYTYPAYKPTAL